MTGAVLFVRRPLVGVLAVLALSSCGDPPTAAKPAAKLSVTTAPSSNPASGAVFATQPVIQVQDADGGAVAQAGTTVTASITTGEGTLGGTASVTTDANGAATFTNLMITGAAGARVLTFSADGLTAATASVTVGAGAATTMTASAGNNQSATVGTAVTTAPAVTITDGGGNPVAGVAVTFAVASGGGSLTGGSATTNASGVAAVGSWTLGASAGANTLTASSTGLTTVTFTATGTAAASPVNISFCATTTPPIWFGYQNGTGAWTQLAAKGDGTYDVPITSVGGIAFVQQIPVEAGQTSSFGTNIVFGTKAELGQLACLLGEGLVNGSKTLNGTTANVSNGAVQVAFGSQQTQPTGTNPSWQLTGAPDGARDLIASRGPLGTGGGDIVTNRFIVRRAISPAHNSDVPVLDFGAAESVIPVSGNITVNGVGADTWVIGVDLFTANGTTAFLGQRVGSGGTNAVSSYTVPAAAQRISTDNYRIFIEALAASNDAMRGVNINNMASFTDRTVTLGAALSTPTVTNAASSPVIRPRVQLASQASYGGGISLFFEQDLAAFREISIHATAGYFGALPTTWDFTLPDMSAGGFSNTWGLQPGGTYGWFVEADSGFPLGTAETSSTFAARAFFPPGPAQGSFSDRRRKLTEKFGRNR